MTGGEHRTYFKNMHTDIIKNHMLINFIKENQDCLLNHQKIMTGTCM